MDYRRFNDTYVVRIERGEEVVSKLTSVCEAEGIKLASIEGLGAADYVVMGLYSVEEKLYHKTTLSGEEFEVCSILGNVSEKDGKPYLHMHICVAGADGIARGGHLNECRISGACEMFLRRLDGHVGRMQDPATGLNIYSFD